MSTLVGREAVLRSVERLLDHPEQGRPVLAVEGGPGIGKTAVWLETVADAGRRGHRVLQARPAQSEAQLSFSGITDLLGAAFDEVADHLPAPQARGLAAALLRGEPDRPVELRAVATGVVTALGRLSDQGPVLVAVDDVQWLDPASQRVLDFVVRRLPAGVGLLMALRREPDGAPFPLLDALPEDLVQREVLQPLSMAALHHLLRDRLGLSLTRPELGRLARATEGNPLFAVEMGRALVARPDERTPHHPLPVPSTLQHLLAARIDEVSDAGREALLVAATLSRPTAALVERALTAAPASDALAEVVDADLLLLDQGRLRFTHPLLASAVYAAASGEGRQALHRRLAALVEDPEERARHLAAGSPGPDEAVSQELELAARRAALRGAPDTAADLYDGAWRLTPDDRPDDLARRLSGQAASLNTVGDVAPARSLARRALDSASTPEGRTTALLLLASIAWFDGRAADATGLAEEALRTAGDDQALLGAVHARLVRFQFSLDLPSALRHADLALPLLGEEEPGLLAQVLVDRMFASALHGDAVPREAADRALALEERALERGDPPHPMPLLWHHCMDDPVTARARFTAEEVWYRERGEDVWVADHLSHLAVAELHAGRTRLAAEHAERSCAALDGLDVAGPRAMVFEKRALVDGHLGRTGRARTTVQGLVEDYDRVGQDWWAALSLSTLAFVEYAAGDPRAADAALVAMRERAGRVGAVDVLFDRSEPFHIEVLLELGDRDGARDALARLEERGRTLPRPWISAALPRARALVAAEDGGLETALAHLDDADPELWSSLPFERGWTLLVRGRLLRRSRQKRSAVEALTAAAELFDELGAPAFAERARRELDRVGLRRTGPELTPSELAIATLAATGLTNREVAQSAFVSQKTVEANLARVYRKLGIRSRAELGSHMALTDRADPAQT